MSNPLDSPRLEPIDKLLFIAIFIFAIILIGISRWAPQDGQTFQVISGILTGFAGAFFARLSPNPKKHDDPPLDSPK